MGVDGSLMHFPANVVLSEDVVWQTYLLVQSAFVRHVSPFFRFPTHVPSLQILLRHCESVLHSFPFFRDMLVFILALQKNNMEIYFPDDIWRYILTFATFRKYYTIPVSLRPSITYSLKVHISTRCFQDVLHILETTRDMGLCLVQLFTYVIHHNSVIQQARTITRLWDQFVCMLAIKAQSYLQQVACACNDETCPRCYVYRAIRRVSNTFYTIYVR